MGEGGWDAQPPTPIVSAVSADEPSFLDDLASLAASDSAALEDLAALLKAVKASDRDDPPDRDALWARVEQRIEEPGDGATP